MDRNLRLLGLGVAGRTFGSALYSPFLALFLLNVLHVGYLEIGVIFVGVGLVQLPFNIVGGLLTDRVGRRRLILAGLAAEAAATAGLAYAFSLLSLAGAILAATLGGLVTTMSGPAMAAYVADFAQGAERTRGFTWFRIGFNAGYSAGVTLGGLLIALFSFAAAVGVGAVAIAAMAAILALTLAASPFDRRLGLSDRSAGGPVAPAERPPARALRESLGILARDRPALELLVAVGLAALVVGQWGVTFPLFVHNVLGISYSLLGVGLALNGLVVVFGQYSTTERMIGRRHTLIAIFGIAMYALAFVGLGAAGALGLAPLIAFFLAVVVLTIGENLFTIPLATLPSNLAPPGEVGTYNGAFALVGSAGVLFAVFLGGVVLSLTANPLLIWVFLVVPAGPSVLLFWDASRRVPRTVDTA